MKQTQYYFYLYINLGFSKQNESEITRICDEQYSRQYLVLYCSILLHSVDLAS
jgi:hypothetical protein